MSAVANTEMKGLKKKRPNPRQRRQLRARDAAFAEENLAEDLSEPFGLNPFQQISSSPSSTSSPPSAASKKKIISPWIKLAHAQAFTNPAHPTAQGNPLNVSASAPSSSPAKKNYVSSWVRLAHAQSRPNVEAKPVQREGFEICLPLPITQENFFNSQVLALEANIVFKLELQNAILFK
jgi:hypothetical protein